MDTPLTRRADALDDLPLEELLALLEVVTADGKGADEADVDGLAAPLLVNVRVVQPRSCP